MTELPVPMSKFESPRTLDAGFLGARLTTVADLYVATSRIHFYVGFKSRLWRNHSEKSANKRSNEVFC